MLQSQTAESDFRVKTVCCREMPTAAAQKQYNCFASSRISPECILHLSVREHCVKNIDLSDEYAECPNQCDSPLPPKLSAYSKIPLVLVSS